MTDKIPDTADTALDLRALVADEMDNVATMLAQGFAGASIRLVGDALQEYGRVPLLEAVPVDHKVAIRPIAADAAVVKFGAPIGRAVAAISAGRHVHIHNVRSDRVSGGTS